MSVYVDPLFEWDAGAVRNSQAARLTRKYGKWSHMTADTETELVVFARKLGLRPTWIQAAGTPDVHFDLVPPRRARAVELGALELTRREAYEKRKAAWAAYLVPRNHFLGLGGELDRGAATFQQELLP